MKSFEFGLQYSCYIQYKVWGLRYTVLSVFLLTVFAINGMHIDYGRKFCHTLLVVFCKWDTSFTKLILKNGLSTTALSKF